TIQGVLVNWVTRLYTRFATVTRTTKPRSLSPVTTYVKRAFPAALVVWIAQIFTAQAAPSGAIFTTIPDGTIVNANTQYMSKCAVYLDGGPGPNAPAKAAGLPAGDYFFQVTDPNGSTLLSTDPVSNRRFRVSNGVITAYTGVGGPVHPTG